MIFFVARKFDFMLKWYIRKQLKPSSISQIINIFAYLVNLLLWLSCVGSAKGCHTVITASHHQMSLLQSSYWVWLVWSHHVSVILLHFPSSTNRHSNSCIDPSVCLLCRLTAYWQCNRCALLISGKCQCNLMCMKSVYVYVCVCVNPKQACALSSLKWFAKVMLSLTFLSFVSFPLRSTFCSFSGEPQQQFHSRTLHLVDFSLIIRPNEYDELWHYAAAGTNVPAAHSPTWPISLSLSVSLSHTHKHVLACFSGKGLMGLMGLQQYWKCRWACVLNWIARFDAETDCKLWFY